MALRCEGMQGFHLLRGVWSLSRNHEAGSPRRSAPSYGHLQGDGAAVFAPACPFHLTFGLTKEGVMLHFQQLAGGQLPVTRHHGNAGRSLWDLDTFQLGTHTLGATRSCPIRPF